MMCQKRADVPEVGGCWTVASKYGTKDLGPILGPALLVGGKKPADAEKDQRPLWSGTHSFLTAHSLRH